MKRTLTALAFSLSLSSLATPALAGGLDVERWLARPGVKLLAVEFYATWCAPCMEAVPRWKALHERYRKEGLRLVVIATQDPQGGCVNPGWNPDEVVCDDEGQLAERFGASSLPSAFLWSWQGGLLVRQQHVEEVERQIESWLAETPRVNVDVKQLDRAAGMQRSALSDLVKSRLRDEDKITVIASAAEQRRLDDIKKRSLSARYDEGSQCELGMALSANSSLEVSVTGGRRMLLRLGLLSAERGCLVASSVVDWNKQKPAVAVAEGVAELMTKLQQKPQMPWLKDAAGRVRPGLSSYDKMARELEAAKAERDRLEKAWTVVKAYASSTSIVRAERLGAVERFLSDFPKDNPHESEARRLIASLRPSLPAPPPKPAPTVRVAGRDADGDGLLDAVDQCPNEPEDMDGNEDQDGCPEPDNDRDGIADTHDKCPDSPETVNGFQDEDGCPDTKPSTNALVVVRDTRIEIRQQIFFEFNSKKVQPRSRSLLDEIANVLKDQTQIGLVEIGGHTDSQGSNQHNQRLSQIRADQVLEELVERGVARQRLRAVGYGEAKPIDSNRTNAGRARNRRIEFNVQKTR